ncbi:radical SAM protein [Candidatus Falkowbacteria bacterium]|nr:radical SAM protein [Candidatus Falkowbacteria bacterium]
MEIIGKNKGLGIAFVPTNLCDRDCGHCLSSANKDNCLFLGQDSQQMLSEEMAKANLYYDIVFTGNGEPIMCPSLPTITEGFLNDTRCRSVVLKTSGVLTDAHAERERLLAVLSSGRVELDVSFNLYADFPERLLSTLKLIFNETNIEKMDVILDFDRSNLWETHTAFLDVIDKFIEDSPEFIDLTVSKFITDKEFFAWVLKNFDLHSHIPKQAGIITMNALMKQDVTYQLARTNGNRKLEIVIKPDGISNMGRARNLKGTVPSVYPCKILKQPKKSAQGKIITLGATLAPDGNFYPCVKCGMQEEVRLGTLGKTPMEEILYRVKVFRYRMPDYVEGFYFQILNSKDPCAVCKYFSKIYLQKEWRNRDSP